MGIISFIRMNKLIALFAFVASVSAKAVSLDSSNFEDLIVSSGKNAFIKFQAPW